MNKENKLVVQACLEEVAAVIKNAQKSLPRKTYLLAKKWYGLQKTTLQLIKYKGKIERFPKHKLRKEPVDA